MAYSENLNVIRKVESVLKLLQGATHEFSVPTKDPRKLAYYLYNAIWLAAKKNYKPYDELENKWKFKPQGDKLLCRPVIDLLEEIEEVEFTGIDDSLEVVAAIRNNATILRYIFKGTSTLTAEEMKGWCEVNNFTFTYDPTTSILTISRV